MKIQIHERPVRIGGHLLRPGDRVVMRNAQHAGREANFRGRLADGRLLVCVKFAGYGQTLARVSKSEIETKGESRGQPKSKLAD
jgi:hypothetical protein